MLKDHLRFCLFQLIVFLTSSCYALPCQNDCPLCCADGLPEEHFAVCDDTYRQGYIQALVDLHFYEYHIDVCVEGCTVYLYNLPSQCGLRNSIICFVYEFPGIDQVVAMESPCSGGSWTSCCRPTPCSISQRRGGIWFPQSTEVYPAMIADPRQPTFSGVFRAYDPVWGPRIGVASFGGCLPIYRWLNVGPYCGDLQISVEGGVWSVFAFKNQVIWTAIKDRVSLLNSDYLIGIPLTYAFGRWAFRLRLYHVSSHLGDEFLVSNPGYYRRNPSREAIDFFASYYLTSCWRIYAGIGSLISSDPTYREKTLYFEYGTELRLLGRRNCRMGVYFQPFLAMYFRNWEDVNYCFDAIYMVGWEMSKLANTGRRTRIFIGWHDGFAFEGQFMRNRTQYVFGGLSFGF